jgi:hypothetical protein
MNAMFKPKVVLAVALVLLPCTAAVFYHDQNRTSVSADTVSLLLPDSVNEKDLRVQVWLDAAAEEGLHLQVVHDSELVDPMFQMKTAGLIIPDQVHREANDAVIGALHRYVEQGGRLMIVYDACTWDLQDRYARHSSRLSDLVGVDYALYDRFGTESITSGTVWGTRAAMQALAIPPGAYMPHKTRRQSTPLRRVALHSGPAPVDDREVLVGYLYGELDYPSFQTSGAFGGRTLLQSATGLVAGENRHRAGDVLFVNLPIGYLVTRTDGMLLHSFLRYFVVGMLNMPCLASVPDGIGGLVMNWHIDAASALKPLAALRRAGIFNHGPFSTDLTAGPDVDEFHDGKGLNLQNDAEARSWVQFLREHGDEVGSHGGWIHNYFGRNVSDANQNSFQQFLVLNKNAVEQASGHSISEYSAPMGNQPAWVTRWLEKNNVIAYYFTGDAGMGPTRAYRDQGRDGDKIWAFPILHFGNQACLEEMRTESVSTSEVKNWLLNIADFTSQLHVARLVYSHPIGAVGYINALEAWFQHADELAADRRFRWYTMTQLAAFLNARQDVAWNISSNVGHLQLTAHHPHSLKNQAWMLPDTRYQQPKVLEGAADVRDQDGYWIVAAKDCKRIKLGLAERPIGNTNSPAGN